MFGPDFYPTPRSIAKKMLGNAVTVPVIHWLGRQIMTVTAQSGGK